jgi:hypothetical protein
MNLFSKLKRSFTSKSVFRKNTLKLIGTLFVAFGTWNFIDYKIAAETAQNIPGELAEELTEIVTEIDTAANEQDLEELIEHYDANFTHEDGLTIDSIKATLEKTWSTYPDLTYKTTINSATQKGDELIAETTTIITGSQNSQGRIVKLKSNIKSRQYFREQKLVRQEIIAEATTLTTGDRPPQIQVNVPKIVKVGEKYNFDTIVTEPLEGNVLLGAALEERIGSNLYLKPSTIELEPLSAGGIFKVVTAPRLKDNHWLSAIIVRGDGITMVTKRVRIEE